MKGKTPKLSCREMQSFIKPYLLNELNIRDAEMFVKHVRTCKECREELEEYYAFSTALMQIELLPEEDKGDFFMNIEKRLEQTEKSAEKLRSDHRKRKILFVLIALAMAAAMGVSIV